MFLLKVFFFIYLGLSLQLNQLWWLVLAEVPLQYGIEAGQLMQDFTFVVVFVSICLTAFLLPLTTRVKADHSPRPPSDPP